MRALFNLTQQQPAAVRADLATVKFTHHGTPAKAVKFQLSCSTLCLDKAVYPLGYNCLFAQTLCHEEAAFFYLCGEKSGIGV